MTEQHNIIRKKYGVPNLKADFGLTLEAVECAKFMMVKGYTSGAGHPCHPKEGENIFSTKIHTKENQRSDLMINAINYW